MNVKCFTRLFCRLFYRGCPVEFLLMEGISFNYQIDFGMTLNHVGTLVRAKIAQVLVVGALICAIGGHWVILQTAAWVGMAMNYSQQAPFAQALRMTFDGKHPCKICKAVNEGRQTEQKQALLKVETKLDFWLTRHASMLCPPLHFCVLPGEPDSAQLRGKSPPTPPPRAA